MYFGMYTLTCVGGVKFGFKGLWTYRVQLGLVVPGFAFFHFSSGFEFLLGIRVMVLRKGRSKVFYSMPSKSTDTNGQ